MEYLKIRNWEKWQSYRSDRSQPPWIKIHRCVMRNPEWVSLSDAERGQLVAIWLLAADHEGVVPASSELIQKLCFMTEEPNLNKFAELGFIDVNTTSTRRPVDANMTHQTRLDKTRLEYSAEFEKFYFEYPLKKGKQAAYKSWVKQKPDLHTCLLAIESQNKEKRVLRERKKFCPEWKHPATWLNQGCWEDETNVESEKKWESVE